MCLLSHQTCEPNLEITAQSAGFSATMMESRAEERNNASLMTSTYLLQESIPVEWAREEQSFVLYAKVFVSFGLDAKLNLRSAH